MCFRKTTEKDKVSEDKRFFISSLEPNVELFAKAVRGHWSIENSCHYVLDVTFSEDKSRIRCDYSSENMAVIRRIANSLTKNEDSINKKMSIKEKTRKANRDTEYLKKILTVDLPYQEYDFLY